jgi:hypothetical protein
MHLQQTKKTITPDGKAIMKAFSTPFKLLVLIPLLIEFGMRYSSI